MGKDDILQELKSVNNLPTLPDVIIRLNQALEDQNINADNVAEIMSDDPAMMTKILKTINSALYALPQEIISISQATALLGFMAVKNIALTTSIATVFDINEKSNFKQDEFWKHSICVGIAMNVLYKKAKGNMSRMLTDDMLHLAGLVHGIGVITFEQFFHIKFILSIRISQNKEIPLVDAQKEVFGIDYCGAGGWLAEKWKLPPPIVDVITYHAQPEKATDNLDLIHLCHIAKYICVTEKLGDYGEAHPYCDKNIWTELGITASEIPDIVAEIKETATHSETLLAIAKG